jgi:hypothetical protein
MDFADDDDGSALRYIFEKNNGELVFRRYVCPGVKCMAAKLVNISRFLDFCSGWEVLLGQGEVKNWLRSTPEKTVLMR